MLILRFEDNEDFYDMEITDVDLKALKELEKKHGAPLDLFRFAPDMFNRFCALPELPYDESRKVDFVIDTY